MARWWFATHAVHLAALCVGQAAPVAADPFVQTHCFVAHWRSVVSVGSLLSYWVPSHVPIAAHVRSAVAVDGSDSYWLLVQTVSGAHCVSMSCVPAAVW